MAADDDTPEQTASDPAKRIPAKKAAKKAPATKTPPAKKVAAKKAIPRKAPAGPAPTTPTTSPDPNRGSIVTDDHNEDASRNGKAASSPESLAADIERTREDLSVTLDAIAEKVSPKRVASRTGKKVTAAVKDSAQGAAESVKDGAQAVKDKVSGSSDSSTAVADPLSTTPLKKDPVIALPPVALAGIAAALVALFLLRRRRRR